MKPKFNTRLFGSLSAIVIALASPSAYSATETFNTAGTFNWVCPPGVTTVQVECWGGGGAGGAGRKDTAAGTNTSQNGGGGGGGAYARRAAVAVTPGSTYNITIPAAAVSGSAGTTTNASGRVNGGTVTFVGDADTTTAAGGTGGANAYTTSNGTTAATGGAGATVAASTGDVGFIFAGGVGSNGQTGSTNVSGSGGGGAGNANAGGAAASTTSTTTAGLGGIAGGGAGGAGRDGGNTNAGVGAPGATPGGGGGGGHNQGVSTRLGGNGGLGQISLTYDNGPYVVKENNPAALNLTTSWVGGVVPVSTDIAKWDSTITVANTTVLGADATWSGIQITNPTGPVTINAGNTLTLGAAVVDIDLSTATQDLTMNNNLAMGATNVWNVAASQTLTLGGAVSGSAAIIKQGGGTATLAGAAIHTGATTVSAGNFTIAPSGSITTASNILLNVSGATAVANIDGSYSSTGGGGVAVNSGGILNTSGTVAISGANNQAILMGTAGGAGTWNVTGGSVSVNYTSNGWGIGVNGLGTLNVSAGSVTTAATNVFNIGHGAGGTGILTVSGTGLVTVTAGSGAFRIGANATSTGTVNLDGGTLALGRGITTVAGSTSTFNFNGGLLQAGLSSATYMTGLTTVNVRDGGAKIDTNGFNVTIGQALVHSAIGGDNAIDGGLTKSGLGTLTLNGANTYTGTTSVSNGALIVNNALASSAISIASGATLGGSGTLGGTVTVDSGTAQITAGNGTSGSLSTQNLTFSGTGVVNVGQLSNYATNPAIDTMGNLSLNGGPGAVTLNLSSAPVASGTYRLVRAGSGITDASGFILGTTPTPVGRQAAGTLQYDSGTKTVTYTTGGTYPIWSGAQSNEWSTNVISPAKNWKLANGGGGTDFIATDEVLFDDSATLKTVEISNGDVFPSLVNFANTGVNDYTLQGSNGITGTAVLFKTGNGKLTITNINSHTGGTTISNGILAFANGTLGTSGPITVNGGTLQWDGTNTQDISSRLTLVDSTTATLHTNGNDVTLASAFGGGTSGGLAKVGSGTLTLSAANTYTGITNINFGTLKIGNATSLGTQTGATDRTIISSGATLDLGGVALGANNEFVTVSGSGVGGNGAITSSSAIATPFIGVRFLTLAGDTTLGFTNRWDVGNNTTGGTLTGGGFTLNLIGSGAGQASFNGLGETNLGDININLGNAATAIAYLQGNTTLGQPAKTVAISGGTSLEFFTNVTLSSYDKKFDLNTGNITVGRAAGVTLAGTISLTGTNIITANAAAVVITASGIISGTGALTKAGAGTLTLTNSNTYTDSTTISAGQLIIDEGSIATSSSIVNNAALEYKLTTNARTYANVISGLGTLTKSGTNTLTLGGLNTYTGNTVVSGGTLQIDGSYAVTGTGTTSQLLIGTGTGTNGTMVISATAGTLTFGGNGYANAVQVGVNGGTGALTINGGTVNLAGTTGTTAASLHIGVQMATAFGTGTVSVNSGTLNVGQRILMAANNAASKGTLTIAGGTVNVGYNGTLGYTGNNPGVVLFGSGTGTLNLDGGNLKLFGFKSAGSSEAKINFNGGTLVALGSPTFFLGNNGGSDTAPNATGVYNTVVKSGGAIIDTNNFNITIPSNLVEDGVSIGGGLTKQGAGILTLSGSNTYTGATTISAGQLIIDEGSIATSSSIVNNGALEYRLTANPRTYASVISGAGTLTKSGANTLTLGGLNTYSGNTTVNAGTLALADNAQLKFVLGATSGVNNSISGSGTVTLEGDFVIDTTAVDATALTTGTWTLVDASTLTETFSVTFSIPGWSEVSNVWTKTVGTKKYTFTEATGILTLSPAASYASWIDGFFPGETDPLIIGVKADPDRDGIPNGVEMVIGGDPKLGVDNALLPTIELVTDPVSSPAIPAGDYILFTYRRTDLSVTGGVAADCETDVDLLGIWTAATGAPGAVIQVDDNYGTFVPAATSNTDRVRVYVPRGANIKIFGRLSVVVP